MKGLNVVISRPDQKPEFVKNQKCSFHVRKKKRENDHGLCREDRFKHWDEE